MPYVIFVFISLVWGASFVLMKKAALVFGPVSIGAWRVVGGTIVLGLLWHATGGRWPIRREHFWSLLLVVLVGYSWPFAVQPYLVARHGSGFVGMTVSLVPLLTLAVSIPLLGVYPTRRQLAGVLGGLVCMAAIVGDGIGRRLPASDLLLAFTVPLTYALTNTYIRRRFKGVPTLALSYASVAACVAILLPLGLATEPVNVDRPLGFAVASLALLGTIGTGLCTFLFNKLIQEHGPLFAGMVTYLVPLGAVAWGWLDGEAVTPLQIAAVCGILAMVATVQFGLAQPSTATRTPP